MADPQGRRVYRFEKEWGKQWNTKTLDQAQCLETIEAACRLYDVPTPTVRFLRAKRGWTWYDPNDHSINIRHRHMNVATCLHEAAHAIHSYVTGDEAHEIHGPEWFAIYINLLAAAEVAPVVALTAHADARNLSYGDVAKHSPRRLRATYRSLWRHQQRYRDGDVA